ncbi:MutS-related protein [Algoriphagus confluentis]|uniref:MutS family DNA mismatch repair protein n=1 Tax=Algoriphagus confluentis TaxID=1697556 RepID=A0ABQ6PRR9_9BACT|nr:MutS family DNA mismatch repair protein [Algoriphagus confluentis]
MGIFDFDPQGLEDKLKSTKKRESILSLGRLIAFFAILGLGVLSISDSLGWLVPTLGLGIVFLYLIRKFNHTLDQQKIYRALALLASRKAQRRDRNLKGLDSGAEFADKNHPYSGDLDLFGDHSLFQLINHTYSPAGKSKLAQVMKESFSPEESQQRNLAVQFLSNRPDFLRAMEASGVAFAKDIPLSEAWKKWLGTQEKRPKINQVFAVLGPLGGLFLLGATIWGNLPQGYLGLWVILGTVALSLVFNPLKQAAEALPVSSLLRSFSVQAHCIEQETFPTPLLEGEKRKLFGGDRSISLQLSQLDQLALWVQNRMNLLYIPVNLLFWTDFILYDRLLSWKSKAGPSLSTLPEHLADWEVWVSLGAFELEMEGKGKTLWAPERLFEAEQMVHPLLLPIRAVPNSLKLDENQKLVLLTGANMSGKTTFMRTLGTNWVLAQMGLSPFAQSLTLGDFKLYTSMRNTDNLGESVSSFYAELFRIKTLIDRLDSGERVLFLLDEILKGTNTEDRISGSRALVEQILQTRGFGIISTHDIELADLATTQKSVSNYSFHSEIQDQEIRFDFLLKEGACPSFNAHKLMELMGIRFGQG